MKNNRIKKSNNIRFGFVCQVEPSRRILNYNKKICNENGVTKDPFFMKNDKTITGKSLSTGVLAALYFLDTYPNAEIILIGFTFNNLVKSAYHNFKGEQEYISILMDRKNIKIY